MSGFPALVWGTLSDSSLPELRNKRHHPQLAI
jgi:hypothetical protein